MARPLPLAWLSLLLLIAACGTDSMIAPPGATDTEPPAAVVDLAVAAAGPGTVRLVWSVPEDGIQAWEIRRIPWPADPSGWADWQASGDTVGGSGVAAAVGLTVGGLEPDATYAFRVVGLDAAGNASAPSNPVVVTAAEIHDTTPPGAVADLGPWSAGGDTITVSWRTTGDDGPVGAAAAWELRWDTTPITAATWDQARPGPTGGGGPSGARQWATLTGMAAGTTYHVAVRTADERGQWSAVSNDAAVTTDTRRTWYVRPDGRGDVASIQAAISVARPGDTILVASGRYTWSSQGTDAFRTSDWGMITFWRDQKDFTLRSEDGPEATIIDPEGRNRCLYIMGYNDGIVIDGFTFTGGDGHGSPYGYQYGGGAVLHLTSPTLRNCIFRNNVGVAGGGVANVGQNTAVFEDCTFVGNRAQVGAGYYGGGSIPRSFLRRCAFLANTATTTGGGAVIDTQAVDIVDCVFVGNSAETGAGALAVYRNHASVVDGCTFVANHGPQTSAIRLRNIADLTVTRSLIAFNSGGAPFFTADNSELAVGCSLVFGNGVDVLPPVATDLGGNVFVDPLLQADDPDEPALRPGPGSPCLPANRDGDACGLIGALPAR
ncbi:hypothetical protein KDM41_16860 [bacterium]|nr:hypothetical protein [bacterium]